MAKKKEESSGGGCGCCGGMCRGCKGKAILVLGILILLNAYQGWFGWWTFVGYIFVLKGLLSFMPNKCSTCNVC